MERKMLKIAAGNKL
jgi:hypothetical protein